MFSLSFFEAEKAHANVPNLCKTVFQNFKSKRLQKKKTKKLLLLSLDELNYLSGFIFYKGSILSEQAALDNIYQGTKASGLNSSTGVVHSNVRKKRKQLDRIIKQVESFDINELKNAALLSRYTEKLLDALIDPVYLKSAFFTKEYDNLLALRTYQFNLLRNMISNLILTVDSKPNQLWGKTVNSLKVASAYLSPLVYLRTYSVIKNDLTLDRDLSLIKRSRMRHLYSVFRVTSHKTLASVSAIAVASALFIAVDANIDYKKALVKEQTKAFDEVTNKMIEPYKAENIAMTKYQRYLAMHKVKFGEEATKLEQEIYWKAAQGTILDL